MQTSARRWLMISFAFWATVINYLDRQTLSVAAPVLRDQFHMNNVEYSRVVFAFLLAYTLSNSFSGPVIDRLGTRLGYALCMAWWSVAAVLHGFATGAFSLGMFRFLLGIDEAGNWPAGVKVATEHFPEHERALASGIFNSGSAVGAILAPPIVAWILLRYGWPPAFVAVGAVGMSWLVLWLPAYRTPLGLASMGSGFAGMLFTLITRWVVDHYSYTPVFISFGLLPLICATILWLLVGELRPIDMRAAIRGISLQEAAIPN